MDSRSTILTATMVVVVVVFGRTLTGVVAMNEKPRDVDVHAPNGSDTSRPTTTTTTTTTMTTTTSGQNVTSSDGLAACPPPSDHAGRRYAVARFNFEHVRKPFIVAAWILFVTLAKIGTLQKISAYTRTDVLWRVFHSFPGLCYGTGQQGTAVH